jgi:bifunctional ADP-heptose synthase (sugar kinase/adenylyltransferase)
LDTRTKILAFGEAIEAARTLRQQGRRLKVVTGCFDPLIAAHAQRLKALHDGGAALMIVVADPPRPILPARARAELVAGLSVVDFVAIPGAGRLEELLDSLETADVVRGEAADLALTRELILHVHARQQAE